MIEVVAITTARDATRAGIDAIIVKSVAAIVEQRQRAPKPTAAALKRRLTALARFESRGVTLLPVRFGTTVNTKAEIEALLAPHARALAAGLAHVRGRRQMTVRVRGRRRPHDRRSGAAYLASLVKAATLPEANAVRRAVAKFLVDERVEASAGAGFIGAVHHLIDADDVAAYLDAISNVSRRRPKTYVVTGPMMPFAFVPALDGAGGGS